MLSRCRRQISQKRSARPFPDDKYGQLSLRWHTCEDGLAMTLPRTIGDLSASAATSRVLGRVLMVSVAASLVEMVEVRAYCIESSIYRVLKRVSPVFWVPMSLLPAWYLTTSIPGVPAGGAMVAATIIMETTIRRRNKANRQTGALRASRRLVESPRVQPERGRAWAAVYTGQYCRAL